MTGNNTDVERFQLYIDRVCGGMDRHVFWTEDGDPDPLAAWRFSEELRQRFGPELENHLIIDHSANIVHIRSTATAVI